MITTRNEALKVRFEVEIALFKDLLERYEQTLAAEEKRYPDYSYNNTLQFPIRLIRQNEQELKNLE